MPLDAICPLCLRPIPLDVRQSLHHLVPKLKGVKGGPVIRVHQICHNEIHAIFTKADLARVFNTPDTLRAHPRLRAFLDRITKCPPVGQRTWPLN